MSPEVQAAVIASVIGGLGTTAIAILTNLVRKNFFEGRATAKMDSSMQDIQEVKTMVNVINTNVTAALQQLARHEEKFAHITEENARIEKRVEDHNNTMNTLNQRLASLDATMQGVKEVLALIRIPKTRSK